MHVALGLGDISLIVEALERYSEYDGLSEGDGEDIVDLLEYLQHRQMSKRGGAEPERRRESAEEGDIPNMVATAIFQREDGKLLTEWRTDGIFAPGALAFPGGRMKHGETETEALRREAEEELGVTLIYPITRLGTLENKGYTIHLFLIREWQGKLPGKTLDAGHDLGWTEPEKAAESMWKPTRVGALRAMAHRKTEENYRNPLH